MNALFAILPNFANFDFKNRVAYGDAVPAAPARLDRRSTPLLWTVVVLGLGLAAFRARDFQ